MMTTIYPPKSTSNKNTPYHRNGRPRPTAHNPSLHFFRQSDLLINIDDSDLDCIASEFKQFDYTARDVIFAQGDPGDKLYLIKTGQVRIFINGLDGSETSVILFGRPGQIFGELAIIDGLPRSASAIAMTDTTVYTLSSARFRDLTRQYPQLAFNFMQILSAKVRYNTRQVDSLASLDVPRRFARKLLELGQNYGTVVDDGVRINTKLTQSHLASLVMTTRESINKVLRTFRKNGWVKLDGHHIIILDVPALRQQAATV
ncbi:MAG TPA: Crp/Fnr family transcriptional regulator [Anaerolineae bacterium]|nr:Crp/Fnr family transcriptional regulator [Anaerolineae bacterium]